jgi:hypothetical protein
MDTAEKSFGSPYTLPSPSLSDSRHIVEVQRFGPDIAQRAHVQIIIQGSNRSGPYTFAHIADAQIEDVRSISGGQGRFQLGPVLVTGNTEIHNTVVSSSNFRITSSYMAFSMFLGKGVHNDGGFVFRRRKHSPQGGQQTYGQQYGQQFLHGFFPPFISEEHFSLIIPLIYINVNVVRRYNINCPLHG